MPFPLLETPALLALGAAIGVATHLSLFIHGEWHIQAPQIAVFHLSVYSSLAVLHFCPTPLSMVVDCVLLLSLGYLPGLFGSIITYRLFFHPLVKAGFTGPIGARVSKLWHVWGCRESKNHLFLDGLKGEYGDFVRTG